MKMRKIPYSSLLRKNSSSSLVLLNSTSCLQMKIFVSFVINVVLSIRNRGSASDYTERKTQYLNYRVTEKATLL